MGFGSPMGRPRSSLVGDSSTPGLTSSRFSHDPATTQGSCPIPRRLRFFRHPCLTSHGDVALPCYTFDLPEFTMIPLRLDWYCANPSLVRSINHQPSTINRRFGIQNGVLPIRLLQDFVHDLAATRRDLQSRQPGEAALHAEPLAFQVFVRVVFRLFIV